MDIGIVFTKIVTTATLIGNIGLAVLLLAYVFDKEFALKLRELAYRFALPFGTLIAFLATVGSIMYAEVVGFPACILCWTQRIFMYPQMFLLGLGTFKKDRNILSYTLLLSVIGGAVGLYHWGKDMLSIYAGVTLPCPAVTTLPSCDKIYVLEYHYITIPMLSLNAFIWLGLTMWLARKHEKEIGA